jgi:hypothetical protein
VVLSFKFYRITYSPPLGALTPTGRSSAPPKAEGSQSEILDLRVEHRIIRCASRPTTTWHVSWNQRSTGAPDSPVPPTGRSSAPPKAEGSQSEILDHCTVQCPMHLRTEDNHGLPNGAPTAPRSLRAIKGPLGSTEHYTSILWAHYNSETPRPCY